MSFPVFKTKIEGLNQKFKLEDPKERQKYFELKAGPEIKKLREYLKNNTFVAYLLGKKNSGKGTYSKMFAEAVDSSRVDHFSIGDMVRSIDKELENDARKKELINYLTKNYRGKLPLKDIISAMEKRSTKILLPTELVLTLVKREMEKKEKKALFIDGFPRDLDQINFSLFFRDLIGHRDDPDVFVLIDVPENVIDERIKWRRVCPACQTSRNLKLLATSKTGYDEKKKEFYLICDNPECKGVNVKMEPKEGDEFGIDPIRERLKLDGKLMEQAFSLHGIPKVLLRNSVPVNDAPNLVDDYELTPEYYFERDPGTKTIKTKERPWVVLDDESVQSFSLMPPPVVVSLIKQMAESLGL